MSKPPVNRNDDFPVDTFYNGYSFANQRASTANENQSSNINEYYSQYSPFPRGFMYPQHVQSNFPPYLPDDQSPSPMSSTSSGDGEFTSTNKRCSWSEVEVKCLIVAYKTHHAKLISTKSTQAKKKIWDSIFQNFKECCEESNIQTEKSALQIKEKWRTLLDKYKEVSDHNKKSGRDRKTFAHFDDINEFMGSSDKINPKHIKQSSLSTQTQKEKATPSEEDIDRSQKSDQTKDDAAADTQEADKAADQGRKELGVEPPKKKRKRTMGPGDSDQAIIQLLEAQQAAIARSEEKDKEIFRALLKSQTEAQERHQEFVVSVLGKLGDIFCKK